jgi:CheY-like chemotaxis protein
MKKDLWGGACVPPKMNDGVVSGVVVVEDAPETANGSATQSSDVTDERSASGSSVWGARRPCAVVVDGDDEVQSCVSRALGAACQTHRARPAAAVALLEAMAVVDVALVDCDQPVAVQAPIFRELARWPGALCVLMSADSQKVEQLRALGLFAPLVLDKPVQPEALAAIRSAALELFGPAVGPRGDGDSEPVLKPWG